jgi:hypothetical protein
VIKEVQRIRISSSVKHWSCCRRSELCRKQIMSSKMWYRHWTIRFSTIRCMKVSKKSKFTATTTGSKSIVSYLKRCRWTIDTSSTAHQVVTIKSSSSMTLGVFWTTRKSSTQRTVMLNLCRPWPVKCVWNTISYRIPRTFLRRQKRLIRCAHLSFTRISNRTSKSSFTLNNALL